MTDHRNARLNEQFKREIARILSAKVRDPRVGSVLVTEVRVTPDLWLARVFFRPMEGSDTVDETLEGLEAAAAFIRRELGRVLRIRRIPELRFLHDTTLDSAMRIEAVLKEVLPDETGAEEDGTEEDGTEEEREQGALSEDLEEHT
jgi:ribosome-binding factor A